MCGIEIPEVFLCCAQMRKSKTSVLFSILVSNNIFKNKYGTAGKRDTK